MTDEKKPFTVTDRRLFTPDGERRVSAESEPEPEPLPRSVNGPAATPPATAGPTPPQTQAVDFTTFLLNLAAQASLLLGQGADPPDLEGVRGIIAILEMLHDKTEGRRTPEEEEVLEGILYELRMGFLKRAGVTGA